MKEGKRPRRRERRRRSSAAASCPLTTTKYQIVREMNEAAKKLAAPNKHQKRRRVWLANRGLAAVFQGPGSTFRARGVSPAPAQAAGRSWCASCCPRCADRTSMRGPAVATAPDAGHPRSRDRGGDRGARERCPPRSPRSTPSPESSASRGPSTSPGDAVCRARSSALPQKVPHGRKYGDESALRPPHLLGGFGRFCYLLPGTGIVLVPEGADRRGGGAGQLRGRHHGRGDRGGRESNPTTRSVVRGAGLLGLDGVAMARGQGLGARGRDRHRRLRAGRSPGDSAPTTTLDPADLEPEGPASRMRNRSRRGGADVVIETAGVATTLADGLRLLRPGGRLVTAGLVVPGSIVTLDASEIARRCATIRGVHNYRPPHHLVAALDFVREQRQGPTAARGARRHAIPARGGRRRLRRRRRAAGPPAGRRAPWLARGAGQTRAEARASRSPARS